MIIFLVDHVGTMADNSHRLHLFKSELWGEYEEAFVDDGLREPVASIMNILQFQGNQWIVLTGISDIFEGALIEWYAQHELSPDGLYMRPWSDIPKTKEPELKLRIFNEEIKPKYEGEDVQFVVLDDNDKVVEAFRNAGIECWQVTNGAVGT